MAGTSGETKNTEPKKPKTSSSVSVTPKSATLKHTLLTRTSIAKKGEIHQGLQDVCDYISRRRSTAKAARAILKQQDNTRAAKEKLEAANKRAKMVGKKMYLATRDSDVANLDLAMAIVEVDEAEKRLPNAKSDRSSQPTEEGFLKFKAKVLQTELSSDTSE